MMYRVYLVIVSALQILVGILAFVYLIKILIGGTITMSPVLAVLRPRIRSRVSAFWANLRKA